MTNVDELRKKRFKYLNLLYEKSGGNKLAAQGMYDLGNELGLSKSEVENTTEYLLGEGLLKYPYLGYDVAITHYGIKEVEKALSHPDQASAYFPPVNIIMVNNMQNSQIQQGTAHSNQTVHIDPGLTNELQKLMASLRSRASELNLPTEKGSEIEADTSTIETQLKSSKPKAAVIGECLRSVRTILEGAAGSVLATQMLTQLPKFLDAFK